jgi:hypothetical protein
MRNENGSSPSLTNVAISGNFAAIAGGGMFNWSSSPDVRNSILWNNQDSSGTGTITATVANESGSAITLTHSLAQGAGASAGSWTVDGSYVDGGNNIHADPLFLLDIDPSSAPTISGNLRLGASSPAIHAGGDHHLPEWITTDLDGNPRISGPAVDMGAYEAVVTYQMTVTKAGTGGGQVTSSPAGIDCGGTCVYDFDYNTVVTLTAVVDSGSTFDGWSGAGCSGTGDCVVTMDAEKSVTSIFEVIFTIFKVLLPLVLR